MNIFFTKDEAGFQRWINEVRHALFELKLFKKGCANLVPNTKEYHAALELKRQYTCVSVYCNDDMAMYLEDSVHDGRFLRRDEDDYKNYYDIFHIWQKVIFPKNKSAIKSVDGVLLGGTIRAERLNKNLTARTFAKLTGIGERSLYHYEEGDRMMKVDDFYRICQVLQVSGDTLLERTKI